MLDEHEALLERLAERPGITRQDLLREAIGGFLAAERRRPGKRCAAEENR